MRFVFQQTHIWEGAHDKPDPLMPEVKVKCPKDDEAKARRQLPLPNLGRKWVLVRKLP